MIRLKGILCVLCSLIVLLSPLSANAQEDSSFTFSDYIDQAYNEMYNNPDTALIFAQNAMQLAIQDNDEEKIAIAFKTEGSIHLVTGDADNCKRCYLEALDIFRKYELLLEEAKIMNNLGIYYTQIGNNDSALYSYEMALDVYISLKNEKLQIDPLINMGVLYHQKGDYDNARTLYTKSLKIAKKLGEKSGEADAITKLAALEKDMGNYSEAMLYYENLILLLQQNSFKRGEASAWHNLGCLYEELGDYNQALVYVEKSLKIREEIGNPYLLSTSYVELGNIYSQLEKDELALDNYYKAHELADEYQDLLNLALSLEGIAGIFLGQDLVSKSIDMFKQALEQYQQMENFQGELYVLLQLAEIYIDYFQDLDFAKQFINKADHLLENSSGIDYTPQYIYMKAKFAIENTRYERAKQWLFLMNGIPNKFYLKEAVVLHTLIHKQKKEVDSLDYYYQKLIDINQAIAKEKYTVELAMAEVKLKQNNYNGDLLNEVKEENNEMEAIQLTFMAFLILMLVLVIVALLLTYKKLKTIQDKLQKSEEEMLKHQQHVEEAQKELLYSREMAERGKKFKTQFLTRLGHEFRTPLNALIGYARLLKKDSSGTKQDYVDNILNAANSILFNLNELHDLSDINKGKVKLNEKPFNPLDVVTQSIEELKFLAEEKQINFSIHIDPYFPNCIYGDSYRIYQILTNLLSNAIKYSDQHQEVMLEAFTEKQEIVFKVIDQGIGIEEAQMEYIFEPYARVGTKNVEVPGMGVGLSVVKKLLHLQGGKIFVDSELGKGSVFTVYIPYKNCSVNSIAKGVEGEIAATTELHQLIYILLVEDNMVNQEIIKDTVEAWGSAYAIDVADNGQKAIEMLQKNDYQIVLMDVQMPVMDGYAATKYIRTELAEPVRSIPIIGMSAHALDNEKDKAIALGMNDYLLKPFNPDELEQKILNFVLKQSE